MRKATPLASPQDWHIPYHEQAQTLQSALASLNAATSATQQPALVLQWTEHLPGTQTGVDVFRTGFDQHRHDCIQIILGRGLLVTDEAFGFGFTLGSASKNIMTEQGLHAYISRYLHAMLASLNEQDQVVFREGVKMAFISGCVALGRFDFNQWLELPLRTLRDAIGLEHELLLAYYAVEQRRYPNNVASARLLPPSKQVVAF